MVKVRVPATSANLGPGFDTIGLAVNIYNTFEFYEADDDRDFEEDNLIYIGAKKIYDLLERDPSRIRFKVESDVPRARGLGSSSTCIVGGMVGANEMLGSPLTKQDILNLATEMEGHPDNVAPALLGGCVFSVMEEGKVLANKLEGLNDLRLVGAIPDFPLKTSLARNALPENLAYKDVVYNLSHLAFLIEGLRDSDIEKILIGCKDRLHEPYRRDLIRGYYTMKSIEESYKGRVFISGAGPTLLFLTDKSVEIDQIVNKWKEISKDLNDDWEIISLEIDHQGTVIL
ncbi:MAG: homoserine kinase [Finegoldia sp.]|nr:homoserine kinase [Finegoldia sp.]